MFQKCFVNAINVVDDATCSSVFHEAQEQVHVLCQHVVPIRGVNAKPLC